MPTKILAVADQISPVLYDYFDPSRWHDIDLVLSCGDLPPDYLDFLATNLGVPVFYVRGNHDGGYDPARYDGLTDLDAKIIDFRGLHIAGLSGSVRYNRGEYQYTEGEMRRRMWRLRLRAIRSGRPDIIVTHAPPAGCHEGKDPPHRGFKTFRWAIDTWHPRYFIHGHMHAYDGGQSVSTIGTTTVLNPFPYRVFEVQLPGESLPHAETHTGARAAT